MGEGGGEDQQPPRLPPLLSQLGGEDGRREGEGGVEREEVIQ